MCKCIPFTTLTTSVSSLHKICHSQLDLFCLILSTIDAISILPLIYIYFLFFPLSAINLCILTFSSSLLHSYSGLFSNPLSNNPIQHILLNTKFSKKIKSHNFHINISYVNMHKFDLNR